MPVPASRTAPPPGARVHRFESAPLALGALALWLVLTLGLRPLLLPDEGRYANVAREMLLGDWLVPTLNGLPFFHKPPLMYWIDIAAMHVFGVTVFAARAASLVGAWIMGAALFLALRRWHGPRLARHALVLLATCPFYFIGAQYANHDMLVAGLISAAVLAFARAVDDPPRLALRWLVAAWVACALAMLAKGLIGIVLPALVIGPWLLAQGRWRQMFKLLHPLGLLAFALVAAPWFVTMQLRYPGFDDYFFVEQHFRRFTDAGFNNVLPIWFFIGVLPLLTLPWSVWLPAALRRAWRGEHPMRGLYAWWLIAIVGFFSLPSSKLVGYVMPVLAPWCVLLALAVEPTRTSLRRAVLVGAALLCLGVVSVLAWQAPKSHRAAALVLAQHLAPGARVVMVNDYFYDLPFYAHLRQPVLIASDWADPDLPKHDNWRKELFDAAHFDPGLGKQVQVPLDQLDTLACGGSAIWFVVAPHEAGRLAGVGGATRIYADTHTELWHAPARACR